MWLPSPALVTIVSPLPSSNSRCPPSMLASGQAKLQHLGAESGLTKTSLFACSVFSGNGIEYHFPVPLGQLLSGFRDRAPFQSQNHVSNPSIMRGWVLMAFHPAGGSLRKGLLPPPQQGTWHFQLVSSRLSSDWWVWGVYLCKSNQVELSPELLLGWQTCGGGRGVGSFKWGHALLSSIPAKEVSRTVLWRGIFIPGGPRRLNSTGKATVSFSSSSSSPWSTQEEKMP